jgi:hypothetical protein
MLAGISRKVLSFAGLLAMQAVAAQASVISVRVTMIGNPDGTSNQFAAPMVTFENLSDPGYLITQTDIAGAFSDWVASSTIVAPAGGGFTALGTTQVAATDQNDGCNALTFGTTSFDPGDNFQYRFDPEPSNCTSAVVDFRTRLASNSVTASVNFSGPGIPGITTLSGNTWLFDLINPGLPSSQSNDRYTMTLTGNVTVTPEPGTWMMLGCGLAGVVALRRRGR